MMHKLPAARVAIIALHCRDHVVDGQVVSLQGIRIRTHLKRLHLTAERIHVRHAFHRQESRSDHSIKNRATLHRRVAFALHEKHKNIAQRHRDRGEATFHAFRQSGEHRADPFAHLLACPVNISPVVEIDRHHRQRKLGDGAQHGLVRNPAHLRFDRIRHALLNLLRRHARRFDNHLDLRAGNIRKRVDG